MDALYATFSLCRSFLYESRGDDTLLCATGIDADSPTCHELTEDLVIDSPIQ